LKKKYGDIQHELHMLRGDETAQLRGYGKFQEEIKGIRDTQTSPNVASIMVKSYAVINFQLYAKLLDF